MGCPFNFITLPETSDGKGSIFAFLLWGIDFGLFRALVLRVEGLLGGLSGDCRYYYYYYHYYYHHHHHYYYH